MLGRRFCVDYSEVNAMPIQLWLFTVMLICAIPSNKNENNNDNINNNNNNNNNNNTRSADSKFLARLLPL